MNGIGVNWNLDDPYRDDPYRRPRYSLGQSGQSGLPSFDPVSFGLNAGAGLVGQVGSWIGGGQQRKDQKWGRQQLKSQYGKDVLNPRQIVGAKKLSYLGNLAPMAQSANKRLGLDSGRAWMELLAQYAQQEGIDLAELMRANQTLKSQRDLSIGQSFYGAQ